MEKYLKLFNNHNEYSAFTQTEEFVKPNVSHCIGELHVHYNPLKSYTVKLKMSIPTLDTFTEKHYDSETKEWIIDKEYTEYDFPIFYDDNNYVSKTIIDGLLIESNTIHVDSSNEGTEVYAKVYLNDNSVVPFNLFSSNYAIVGIEFGDSVEEIEGFLNSTDNEYAINSAFGSSYKEYIILNNVKRLGAHAFYNKLSLTNFVSKKTSPTVIDLSNVDYIGNYALHSMVIEGDIHFKENVLLELYSLYNTTVHGKFYFPTSYTNINLSTVSYFSYDENTKIVNSYGFDKVDKTTMVKGKDVFIFSDNVNSITTFGYNSRQSYVFAGPLLIPDSVNSITNPNEISSLYLPFNGHSTMICESNIPPTIGNNTLINDYDYTLYTYIKNWTAIYVPDESVEAYKSAQYWSEVASSIKPISEYSE